MNREQWYQERRKWRAALRSIDRTRVHQGLSESEQKALWDIFWEGVYQRMPREIYKAIYDNNSSWQKHWPPTSQANILCNLKFLRNSYPHRGRSV